MAHGPGHAPAPAHPEPAHKPKPPDHVKPVEDPSHQLRLKKLAGDFHTRAQAAYDHVLARSGTDATGRTHELVLERVRQLRDKAGEYSVGLYGYWTYAKERFSDAYIYRSEGKIAELNELLGPLKDTDARLEKQLQDWAEATSPYGDTYDAKRIEERGRDLSETLKIASAYLANRLRELPEGERGNRDASFNGAMLLAVSGLAEQIGSRMADLGSGKTVPDVTMSNATLEIMNRAGQDDSRGHLESRFEAATDTHDALKKLTPDQVNSLAKDYFRIEREIDGLWKKNRDDPNFSDRLEKLSEELKANGLASFFHALDEHLGNQEVKAGKERFDNLTRDLNRLDLKQGQYEAFLAERKDLLETMLPNLRKLTEATVQQNTERLNKYETNLSDSTDSFHDDPYDFWSKTKKKVLEQIGAVAGEDTRKKLDEAFSSANLSGKVGKWNDLFKKGGGNPDAATMQSRASDVVTTADKYIERVEGVLKDANADDALRELKDQLVSALTAIKLSTAEHLRFQFKLGRFNK
jgi:hypothetical protein